MDDAVDGQWCELLVKTYEQREQREQHEQREQREQREQAMFFFPPVDQ